MLKRLQKSYLLILLLGLSLGLSGCFKDQPSDSEIVAQTKAYFNQQQPSLLTATSVIKQNGYKQDDTHYVAEMAIQATAKQSLNDYIQAIAQDPSLSPFEKMAATLQAGLLKLSMDDFKAGDIIKFTKQYIFIKTDNGWQLKGELKPQS